MLLSNFQNPRINLIWAVTALNGPYAQIVPMLSQESITDGAASFETGYPPLNFIPKTLGGVGPFGRDMNGVLTQITTDLQWIQAGGPYLYFNDFVITVGGYPHKAMIQSSTVDAKLWFSLVDNNLANPDNDPTEWRSLETPPTADLLGGFSHDYVQVTVGAGLAITNTPDASHRTLKWDPPDPVVGLNENFFIAAGTFTVTIRAKACKAVLIGGGGGSGSAGGGGGAGASIFLWLSGLTPGNTMILTVGGGGLGAGSGGPTVGGDTTLGSGTQSIPFYAAGGGQIGTGGNGGQGGTFTVGDANAFASIGNGGGGAGPQSGGGLVTIFGPTFGSGGGATAHSNPRDAYGGICVIDWIN